MRHITFVAIACLACIESAVLPSWQPTYNMSKSTVVMPCNYSGMFSPSEAGKWGIASFDWSNGKLVWANQKPMDSEAQLLSQVEAVHKINPQTRTFVYKNLVKALPWFGSVRAKLVDPQYRGWFLKYRGALNDSYSSPPCTAGKCSRLFHDQDQTPAHSPDADGRCYEPCDCGDIPCGEYLWDHRNASLRDWLVREQILGPTALGNPQVSGLFLDDEWQDTQQPNPGWGPPEGFCTSDPWGGPSEVFPNCTKDMGLSRQDIQQLTAGWKQTVAAAQSAALGAGAWIWQMFHVMGGPPGDPESCAAYFHSACSENSTNYNSAVMFTFSNPKSNPLPSVVEDVATFLLIRGAFSWIGYQWVGCVGECHLTQKDPRGLCDLNHTTYERPPELDTDFGTPLGRCVETAPGSNIFKRDWSKAKAMFDCNQWQGNITTNFH